uniref:B30.2/SPRY domain-containing protein n=1 Tax=Mola mola TaxID=94237 RepID=A0A3Q3XNW9_MOLML
GDTELHMATIGSMLSEQQLLCPICLDVFNLPVSTPCGHNFCKDCLQEYWHSAELSQCPTRPHPQLHEKLLDLFCTHMCIRSVHSAHQTPPTEDKSVWNRGINTAAEDMIKGRLRRIGEINQTVQLSRENTEREIQEGSRVFEKLLHFAQRGQAELVEVTGAQQRLVESRASGLIAELEQEIDELKQNRDLLNDFPAPSALPVSDAGVESAVHVGTVRRALRRVMKRLCKAEIQRVQQYAVDVTLDPDTAHPKLVLSENRKQVYHGDVAVSLPDNPERFYPGVSVLGKEGFSSGRFYYEVEVTGKTEWDIGVGLESVNRKGGNTLNPENGYWTLGMRRDQSCWALSSIPLCVLLDERLQRVGVYVDVEWGQVSFYNVFTAAHIYSFTGCLFSERLFPYFNPRRNHSGVNSAPLIIPPVNV